MNFGNRGFRISFSENRCSNFGFGKFKFHIYFSDFVFFKSDFESRFLIFKSDFESRCLIFGSRKFCISDSGFVLRKSDFENIFFVFWFWWKYFAFLFRVSFLESPFSDFGFRNFCKLMNMLKIVWKVLKVQKLSGFSKSLFFKYIDFVLFSENSHRFLKFWNRRSVFEKESISDFVFRKSIFVFSFHKVLYFVFGFRFVRKPDFENRFSFFGFYKNLYFVFGFGFRKSIFEFWFLKILDFVFRRSCLDLWFQSCLDVLEFFI